MDYEVEPGEGHRRNDFIKEKGIKTYLIVRKKVERDDSRTPALSEVRVTNEMHVSTHYIPNPDTSLLEFTYRNLHSLKAGS